jgi:hypothetical protein
MEERLLPVISLSYEKTANHTHTSVPDPYITRCKKIHWEVTDHDGRKTLIDSLQSYICVKSVINMHSLI